MKESSGDGKGFGARLFRSSKKKQYGVWPPPYTTLAEVLRARAQTQPDRLAYVHLKDGETESERITYGELEARARAIAARLQQKLDVGSRALLLYQPGIEYICAFLGCIYAGAAAVPAYPPDPNPKRLGRTLPRLLAIMRDADLSAILTTSDIASVAGPLLAQSPDCAAVERIATDTVPNSLAEQWKEPAITGGSVAFIQYTSGSTASPKGVMVSHTNLLYNFEDLDASNEHDPTSVMVTWLPMYHDMGLVFGILIPLYVGFPCYFMAPMDFLSKPVRWLQAITKYKATHTGAPNFALDYCVRRISPEERAALNLRNLEYIAEGSEPVRKSTLDRFIAAYKPCGLRETAICPSYGMAESVLKMTVNPKPDPIVYCCVSSTELEQRRVKEVAPGAPDAYTLVGCGKGQLETRVEIVDPETLKRAAPDSVGEIWITSPGVCLGYWRRPEETRETFQAHLADTGEGPFLRTGDLGFFLRGELYITGRIKDLIILHGANYYPQDFEAVAEESHPALRPGCCAAFPLDAGGEEQVVIVQEVDEKRMAGVDPAEVAAAIRQAIREAFELDIYAIALIEARSIPKTSSGKIQRAAARIQYLQNSLDLVALDVLPVEAEQTAEETRRVSVEHILAASAEERKPLFVEHIRMRVARMLHQPAESVSNQTTLAEIGLTSVRIADLVREFETDFDIHVYPADILDAPSLEAIADYLVDLLAEEERGR